MIDVSLAGAPREIGTTNNFKKEKQQYAEDQANHKQPWKLWQYALAGEDTLHWHNLHKPPEWAPSCEYRRKPTVKESK